ncbi:probable sodium/metabolite cotransporter BASS4, chloroplastic [Tanacetum coccineum]
MQLAGGNSALALAMTILSSLLGVLIVPFSISKLAGKVGASVPADKMFKSLIVTVLIPLIMGKVFRDFVKGVADIVDSNRKLLSTVGSILLSLREGYNDEGGSPWLSWTLAAPRHYTAKPLRRGIRHKTKKKERYSVLHIVLLCFNFMSIHILCGVSGGSKSIFAKKENYRALLLVASQKTVAVLVAVVEQLGGTYGEAGLLVLPCLPCGHTYGLSCIQKCLELAQGSEKCPMCKRAYTLNDVRVHYATRLCAADVVNETPKTHFPFTKEGFSAFQHYVFSLEQRIDALEKRANAYDRRPDALEQRVHELELPLQEKAEQVTKFSRATLVARENPLNDKTSACSLSTLHFLKLLENKLESMMILENKLESLKLLENKLESMMIWKIHAIATISPEQQNLIDLQQAMKLSRQESAFEQLSEDDDDSEGDDNVDEARQYRVRIRRAKKQTPPIEQHSSPMISSQDDIYRYLNENPAPTMGDVGLLVDVGMSGLNSHDGSSRNEKPCGDSFDPGLLFEPQTVVLQEDPVTELGAPDQRKTPGAIPTPVESSPGEILAKQACRRTNLVRGDETPPKGSTVVFAKLLKKFLKTTKLTKEDIKRIKRDDFYLLKSIFKSNTEFEYNLEQVALAMSEDRLGES